jgi:hypothetical protein
MFDAGVKLGVDGDHATPQWKFMSEAGIPAVAIIQACGAR